MTPTIRFTKAITAILALSILAWPVLAGPFSPNSGNRDTTVFTDVPSVVAFINTYDGRNEQLRIAISDGLQDPEGVNMAMVTDAVLASGYWPGGFAQFDGYRVYIYRDFGG